MLPPAYAWLAREPGPKMLVEALKTFGTHETAGAGNNPTIMAWARETGAKGYTGDSIAWCGLTVSVWALRAGWPHQPKGNALWALNWATWGNPAAVPMLGDVLVFQRKLPGGGTAGHVGLYVGEDATRFYVLGGNQKDQVCIVPVEKARLVAARRAPWRVSQPANVRRVALSAAGPVSTNEA
jgi:uncharacterized protein (TIGR02594 family)